MGQKRHFKGNNRSDDKKRRREAEEKWKSSRGDDRNSYVQVSTNTKYAFQARINSVFLTLYA